MLAIDRDGYPLRAFAIDPVISVHLGALTVRVSIHQGYVQKIRDKHRISPALFEQIPVIANNGHVFIDDRAANNLLVFGAIGTADYKMVLKGIPVRNEIWIATFHRTKQSHWARAEKQLIRVK